MRILFDARKISPQATGVGYVVKKLLGELLRYKDLEITAFTKKGVSKIFADSDFPAKLTVHETADDSEYFGVKRVLYEQIQIPKLIEKYKPDLLHLTNGFGVPLLINKKNLKVVLTVHDLIPLTPYRELMSPLNNLLFKILFSAGIKDSDSVVTVSKFTAGDVKKYFPTAKNINVAYNGIDPAAKIGNPDQVWSDLQKKYNINQDFLLYIGGFAPRKNVLKTLAAFHTLVKDKKYNYQLLLCGKFTQNKDVKEQISRIKQFIADSSLTDRVRLIGYLNPEEKTILLTKAKLFIYLSLYEGFGLPVLESLAVGTPVLTSKSSAMAEVAEKFSVYADPTNSADVFTKMEEIIINYASYKKIARSAMIELIPQYSWEKTAKMYYQFYTSLR